MAKASIYWDKRRKLKNGTYPIMIRVTNKKVRRYYKTGYHHPGIEVKIVSEDTGEKETHLSIEPLFSSKIKGKENKIIRDKLFKLLNKAEKNISELPQFDFRRFEELYLKKSKASIFSDVFESFKDYQLKLEDEQRASTANSYYCAANSIKDFAKKELKEYSKTPKEDIKMPFSSITVKLLEDYEQWMTDAGNSVSTVGIYLRNLRRIYNISINEGFTPKEYYPFGIDKYVVPSSVNHKRALTFEQVNQIFNHNCYHPNMEKFRDIWMFSYLCQGMNFKDIANLKWSNLDSDKLYFIRQKSSRANKGKQKKTIVYLTTQAKNIINKWGVDKRNSDNNIFPFFTPGISEERKLSISKQQIKNINKWMKRIALELEFDVIPTFYYARHTYATILRNSGASIDYISEALGHNSTKTTQNYLDSFEETKVREYNSRLLDPNFN